MEESRAAKAIEAYLASLICVSGTSMDSLEKQVVDLRARTTRELLSRIQYAALAVADAAPNDDQALISLARLLNTSTPGKVELARSLFEGPALKRRKLGDSSHQEDTLALEGHNNSDVISRKSEAAKVIHRVVLNYWRSYKLYCSLWESDDEVFLPKFMHKRYYPPKHRQLWMGMAVWKVQHTCNRRKEIAELATNTWQHKKLSLSERFNKAIDLLTLQEIWDIGW